MAQASPLLEWDRRRAIVKGAAVTRTEVDQLRDEVAELWAVVDLLARRLDGIEAA